MAIIKAADSEFAVATGSNVDATSRYSYFDEDTNAFENLVITSDPDDDEPFLFEVGETYTLSFGDADGGSSLMEATVIRSDLLGSEAGKVVFEGVDPEHGPMQIVWSPNIDVDQWVLDKQEAGYKPSFYNYDTQTADYGYVCFTAGTQITTPTGPRAAVSLGAGDEVLTQDAGAQRIVWAGQRRMLGRGASAPVHFPTGLLGNTAPLLVSQHHRILVTGPQAELMFGSYEVLVPAKALIGEFGGRLAPCPQVTYVHLLLENHEILFADGTPAESLFLGDVARRTLDLDRQPNDPDAAMLGSARAPGLRQSDTIMTPARPLLTVQEGTVLATSICATEALLPDMRRLPA